MTLTPGEVSVYVRERLPGMRGWKRDSGHVFHKDGKPLVESLLGQQQARMRALLKMPKDFVLHSLRHTFGTRLGETGCDAFGIMRLMGHSSVIVSQRYVHPSPEALELAFGRMIGENLQGVPTKVPTVVEAGVCEYAHRRVGTQPPGSATGALASA